MQSDTYEVICLQHIVIASELLENLEEMFPRYMDIHSVSTYNIF